MEEKYESRSAEKVNNFQILCPEHGEQATYVLYYTENATRKTASGCWKCFAYLPVNPTPHCSDSVENDQ
jgi:hypothetical protein